MPSMYRKMSDFKSAWDYESEATLKMLRQLTDASLPARATPETRTLGNLAWHIVCSLGEMMIAAGLPWDQAHPDTDQAPGSAAAIAGAYENAARAAGESAAANWNGERLNDAITMYGETWTKGFTLAVLILHQAHHRGQMTVLMRMAGLQAPGVYGPSREEWAAMGMQAPA